ncbi:hypothetical protein BG015_011363 [Linnemannia schmuckeri]|uniref:Uncharacterized protein n=1 Tax=Linnemannia schmuckeri TaxID=64567 RepID=A0A9P5V8F9_9FUNG|nr:hypothetical protein BG015_011363 [Linnemannia schmuckeri]
MAHHYEPAQQNHIILDNDHISSSKCRDLTSVVEMSPSHLDFELLDLPSNYAQSLDNSPLQSLPPTNQLFIIPTVLFGAGKVTTAIPAMPSDVTTGALGRAASETNNVSTLGAASTSTPPILTPQAASAIVPPPATINLFLKEMTDHLVEMFFEHSFNDLNLINPGTFLRAYFNGTVGPTLLGAACMVTARLSLHPAGLRTLSQRSGEPWAEPVCAKIGTLLTVSSLDNVSDGTAAVTAESTRDSSLLRHGALVSDQDRLEFEANIRTYGYLTVSDFQAAATHRGYGPNEYTYALFRIVPLIAKLFDSGVTEKTEEPTAQQNQSRGSVSTSLFSSQEHKTEYI